MAREMKDSKIEWAGRIPTEWKKDKVLRLFGLIGSGTTPKFINTQSSDDDVHWIQSGDITGRYILSAKTKYPNPL